MALIRKRNVLALVAAVLGFVPFTAYAQEKPVGVVSHLNLVSDKSQDMSTLEAWKKTYIKDGMSEQEAAIAIYQTMVRYRQQASPPQEHGSDMTGGHVHDPLKTVHVYGYGQCCCVSGQITALARYLGMDARGRNITLHSVPELFYNNSWHLIDASVMNYHVKDDGQIASVDEINAAVRAWFADGHTDLAGNDKALRAFGKNGGWKNGPALLAKADKFYGKDGVNSAGWHGWHSSMQEYYKVDPVPFEFGSVMGYQLNVQLRPGEKITRNFFSRGIEFTNSANPEYYKNLLDRKQLGQQSDLGDKAPGRIGDGRIEWTVPLAQVQSLAFASDNIAATAKGIAAAEAGKPASLTLRFPSSYVYTDANLAMTAAIADGGAIVVSFSDTNGADWKEVTRIEKGGEQSLDLKQLVKRRYDYRLRFDLIGAGTAISAMKSTTDFQCSQAALPVLTTGENKLTFSAGAPEGTITIEGAAAKASKSPSENTLLLSSFKPELVGVSESLRLSEGKGTATFKLETPGDMKRIRISSFWRARDAKDGFEIQVSYDGGKTFSAVEKLPGGTRGNTSYKIVSDIPAGTRSALVRFAGEQRNTTALFDLRLDADYAEPAGGFKPVAIRYEWEEAGQPKTATHIAKSPSDTFTINCGPGAKPRSFTMELQ